MKARPTKKVALYVSCTFVLLATLVAALPAFLSTTTGKNFIVSILSKKLPGTVEVESCHFSWFRGQTIENLRYLDLPKEMEFSCEKIHTDASLFSLLIPPAEVGDLMISEPRLLLKKDWVSYRRPNIPDFQKASLLSLPSITIQNAFPVIGNINVKKGMIEIASPSLDPIIIQNLDAFFFFAADHSNITGALVCETLQKGVIGNVSCQSVIKNINTPEADLSFKADIAHLPVRAADQILSVFIPDMQGLLMEAIGPSLDLHVGLHLSSKDFASNIQWNSPLMTSTLETEAFDNSVVLKNPASLKMTVTPALWKKISSYFSDAANYSLQAPVYLTLTLDQMAIPIQNQMIDPSKVQFASQISTSICQISHEGKPFFDASILGKISSSNLASELHIASSFPITYQNKPSKIQIEADLKQPLSIERTAHAVLSVDAFPTALADSKAADLLGTWIGAKVDAKYTSSQSEMTASITTPFLSIDALHAAYQKGELSLLEPCQVRYLISPALLESMLGQEAILTAPTPLTISLDKLSLPSADFEQIEIKAQMAAPSIVWKSLGPLRNYSIHPFQADVEIRGLQEIFCEIKSEPLSLSAEAAWKTASQEISLKKPLALECTLSDAMLASLINTPERPLLLEDGKVKVSIEPTTFSLQNTLPSLQVKGSISSPLLSLQNSKKTAEARLQNIQSNFSFMGNKNVFTCSLQSSVSTSKNEEGKISIETTLSQLIQEQSLALQSSVIHSNISLEHLPISLIDTCCPSISALLGTALDAKIRYDRSLKGQSLAVDASSDLLQVHANVDLKPEEISLASAPLEISYKLTPDGYLLLDRWLTASQSSRPFLLSEPSTIRVSFSKLYLPFLSNGMPDLMHTEILGSLKIDEMGFFAKENGGMVSLKNSDLLFQKSSTTPLQIQINASAESRIAQKNASSGSITVDAKFDQLFDTQGQIDLSHIDSEVHANVQKLPSSCLDLLARLSGQTSPVFSAMFGPSINASVDTKIQDATGPLKLNVYSPNTRFSMVGKLSKGVLTLDEPIYGQITMTPSVSALFLKEVNPLSISAITSQHPITLEIAPQGFSLPLMPFNKKGINIPQARIELGQIYCKNEGNINLALGLLKSKQLSKNKDLELWFAPIDLHILEGIVDIERTEVLIASTYDIALWGAIDLPKDRVDMILGLTAQCLNKAFGIKNLPPDYVLHIPMRGTMDNVQINSGKATAKIAALLAWQQKAISGSLGGGPAGALFGEFMNKLGSLPGNDASTPPAKKPFPWEANKSSNTDDTPRPKKKTHLNGKEKPLKQLLKILK